MQKHSTAYTAKLEDMVPVFNTNTDTLPSLEDTFDDSVIATIAALIKASIPPHEPLSYLLYAQGQEALGALFGERGLHANLQIKWHTALLTPSEKPRTILKKLMSHSKKEAHPHLVLRSLSYSLNPLFQKSPDAPITHALQNVLPPSQDFPSQVHNATQPDDLILAMLENHTTCLNHALNVVTEQARRVINATLYDLDCWAEEHERSLEIFEEMLILKLMEGVNHKVIELNNNFAKPSVWVQFANQDAKEITQNAMDTFIITQNTNLTAWEDKLRLLAYELDSFSRYCLASMQTNNVAFSQTNTQHFLVKSHNYMQNLALVAAGASLSGILLAPITLLLGAGSLLTLMTANPLTAIIMVTVTGSASAIYHLGNTQKQRTAFLKKKRKECNAYAKNTTKILRKELTKARKDIATRIEQEVHRGFVPALQSLHAQGLHMRLFLDVMQLCKQKVITEKK